MDGEDILLWGGLAALFLLIMSEQKKNSMFTDFMASSGASEADILNSIVPSDSTGSFDATQQSSGGSMSTITDWANAIFHFEGGKPGNLNVRNNNPGNLKFAGQPGAVAGQNGFAVFQSIDDGFAALNRQLTKWLNEYPSLTLTQFYAKYLGQSDYLNPQVTKEGNPFTYASNVAGKLGVSPDQTIGQIFGGA